MENKKQHVPPILEAAWRRFAQLDAVSGKRADAHLRFRKWIAGLGVLAALLTITTVRFPELTQSALGAWILKFLLVASPIGASVLAAYVSKYYSGGDWLITRAGAEEILKEIYTYRSVLKQTPGRRAWLEKRLNDIQRTVYHGMNGELLIDTYEGVVPPPPRFDPKYDDSDPGFDDLDGEEYFKYRLQKELTWHVKKITQRQNERVRLTWLILLSGAVGAILAALGDPFTIWVSLTASITATMLGWQELRNLDVVVRNYSKVVLELNIIADHWVNLTAKERTQTEFNRMVRSTEDVLWSRNVEYIKAMQEALKEADLDEEASLINRVIQEQREADARLKQSMEDAVVDQFRTSADETNAELSENFKEILGTLAEEASSDIVRAELEAMQSAIKEKIQDLAENLGLASKLKEVEDEFADVEIGPNTPPSVLNDYIARFPKTNEAKG